MIKRFIIIAFEIISSIIKIFNKVLAPFKRNKFLKKLFWGIYLRLLFQITHLVALLPLGYHTQNRLAYKLGSLFSPWRQIRPILLHCFQTALGVNYSEAKHILNQWEASKGLATLDIYRYAGMNKEWVKRFVEIDEPEILDKIVKSGGLVLTYHTFHQHTLAIILGLYGIKLTTVSAPVKNLPYSRYTGRYQHLRLTASEKKFSGGHYIYTDNIRNMIKSVNAAFSKGDALLVLSDTHHIDSTYSPMNFLGQSIKINAAGILRMTKSAEVPVYFALIYPDFLGKYRIHLKSIGPLTDLKQGAQAYFSFFEKHLRKAPWAWQGWWWYPTMMNHQRLGWWSYPTMNNKLEK